MDTGEKYLPIGSICNVKNHTHPFMIMGYYSIVYNDTIRIYDYKGCIYPEGILSDIKQISFNHDDITSIVYMGYKNESFDNLNSIMNNRFEDIRNDIKKNPLNNKFKFDENGVVMYEAPSLRIEPKNKTFENKNVVSNPFHKEYVEKQKSVSEDSNWPIFEFDENGIIINEYKKED